jgi:hypothetical protein
VHGARQTASSRRQFGTLVLSVSRSVLSCCWCNCQIAFADGSRWMSRDAAAAWQPQHPFKDDASSGCAYGGSQLPSCIQCPLHALQQARKACVQVRIAEQRSLPMRMMHDLQLSK